MQGAANVTEEATELKAMKAMMERQEKHEAHDVSMKDAKGVGETLRLGTTRIWCKPSELLGWVRSTMEGVGLLQADQMRKSKLQISGDMDSVMHSMAAELNKEGV